MSAFLTTLEVEEVDQNRWRLLADLVYQSDLGGTITVPTGFVTDLESVPRWLPLAYAFAKGEAKRAAVVHDFLYRTVGCPKSLADNIFYEAMVVLGVNFFRRWAMYEAVYWFGNPNYSRLQFRSRMRLARGVAA